MYSRVVIQLSIILFAVRINVRRRSWYITTLMFLLLLLLSQFTMCITSHVYEKTWRNRPARLYPHLPVDKTTKTCSKGKHEFPMSAHDRRWLSFGCLNAQLANRIVRDGSTSKYDKKTFSCARKTFYDTPS